jgi:hypothetical protein
MSPLFPAGLHWFLEHSVLALIMLHYPTYARLRESLLLGYDIRGVLYLMMETHLWTAEGLAGLTGGTSKVVLFLVCLQVSA